MGMESISIQNCGIAEAWQLYFGIAIHIDMQSIGYWKPPSRDAITGLTAATWTYRADGDSHRQEAWLWRFLQIVPHRWGRKACILYFHLLITDTHSPPRQCQLDVKDEYALQGTIHLHSSFRPIFVNGWTQSPFVYGLGIKEKKWKRRVKWEEKRAENCLSRPSPLLHIAYLLLVIGSFNVVRGFRWRA